MNNRLIKKTVDEYRNRAASPPKFSILVVDDSLTVRMQTKEILEQNGFNVHLAENGTSCLRMLRQYKPDAILLDIIMPEMDGIEVCRKIKNDDALKAIPILILTTVTDIENKVNGLNAGADDYITKPFESAELNARINSILRTRLLMQELKQARDCMEELAEERAKQLVHADRLALLGTLSAGIAHEINNPTTFISLSVHTLEQLWKKIDANIDNYRQSTTGDIPKCVPLLDQIPDVIQDMQCGVDRIKSIVQRLTLFARKEKIEKKGFDLIESFEMALHLTRKILNDRNIAFNRNFTVTFLSVYGNNQQIEQIFVNLIINAADALSEIETPEISIDITNDDTFAYVRVADNGTGISPQHLEKIWDPFFTTKAPGKGTGLGLAIIHSIIEEHGGKISASNREEGGMRFEFSLPLHPPLA